MKRMKHITLLILFTVILSITMPVSSPILHNVQYANAATVQMNKKSVSLFIKDTIQLELLYTTKSAVWSTSNKTVATVSTSGNVTAVGEGKATIAAKIGTKKYTSTIEVKAKKLSAVEIYAKARKATVEIVAQVSESVFNLGSGFYIDTGILVTNFHVVDGASKIQAITYDGTTYTVEQVLGYDETLDIAILKTKSNNSYLKENDRGATAGEKIYIIGSPLGLTGSFSDGMVSSEPRVMDNVSYIQVTAPMSRGNSGGPLLNEYGEVMGINTWQYANGQNLNFSINIEEMNKVNRNNPITVEEFHSKTSDTDKKYIQNENTDSDLSWKLESILANNLSNQNSAYLVNGDQHTGEYYIIIPK